MPDRVDATAYAKAIDDIGKSFGENMRLILQLRFEQNRLEPQLLSRLEAISKMPPETRQMFLKSAAGQRIFAQVTHPEAFDRKGSLKKGQSLSQFAPEVAQMMQPTKMELAEQQKLDLENAGKATANLTAQQELKQKTAEAETARLQADIASGRVKPSEQQLMALYKFQDPGATALMTRLISDKPSADLMSDLEMAKYKGGPQYIAQQKNEWFGKLIDLGMPFHLINQMADAIANKQFDKLPVSYTDLASGQQMPIRSRIEREVALNEANAVSRAQEVRNTQESSITSATQWLMKEAGLTQDQARANVIADRMGKPAPFPTPVLTSMAAFNTMLKGQEIEKNTQAILNDKAGINTIREAITSMVGVLEKEGGWTGKLTGAQERDLTDKSAKLLEFLNSQISGRFGVQFTPYEQMHPWRSAIAGGTLNTFATMMKDKATADAWSQVLGKDALDFLGKQFSNAGKAFEGLPGPGLVPGEGAFPSIGEPKKKEHTPEQKKVMQQIADGIRAGIQDPNTPPEQVLSMKKFVAEKLIPAYDDPDKFLAIFTGGGAGNIPAAPVTPQGPKEPGVGETLLGNEMP